MELALVMAVTVGALVLFVTDALPVEIVALLTLSILLLTGVLTVDEGLAGFSSDATIAIGAMFVLSEGLRQTGALERLTSLLTTVFRRRFELGLLAMMLGAGFVSAFINNVAVVAVMMPVVLSMARTIDVSPSRLLIPLSFAAMFGGSMTLIGTSSTLLVSGLIEDRGLDPIGMFEVTPLGLVLVAVGTVYLLTVGPKLLPDRPLQKQWSDRYQRSGYRAQVRIGADHDRVGRTAPEFFESDDTRILGVYRDEEFQSGDVADIEIRPGDILRISTSPRHLSRLDSDDDIDVLPLTVYRTDEPRVEQPEIFQLVIGSNSGLIGKTLRDVDFTDRHRAMVVGLRRAGRARHRDLLDEQLRGGDVLLVEAPAPERERLRDDEDFVVVSEVPAERFKPQLLVPILAIFATIVILAALGIFAIVVLAVAGCVAMVMLNALTPRDAYRAVDWQVIFLLGGFIPLGTALEKVGAIDIIAHGLVAWLGGYGPVALLAGFYFTTNFMSDLISNQATAVLVTPVAVATAGSLGIDPRPFVIAIAFAASDSFASPVGYHTNVMIYGAGNYKYLDFVKIGVPLNLLFLGAATLVIPLFWSF